LYPYVTAQMCFTKEARSQQTTGLFYTRSSKQRSVYDEIFIGNDDNPVLIQPAGQCSGRT
jgi:hypothetical protein